MPYSEGRVVHDADAHIMETPTWLRDHAEAGVPGPPPGPALPGRQRAAPDRRPGRAAARPRWPSFERLRDRHASAEYRADEEAEIMARKNFAATGSFIAEDRPRALDLLGFSSQLVFNTFHNGRLHDMEHAATPTSPTPPPGPTTGACSSSARSTPACCPRCYVPLVDPERAVAATADDALDQGAAALLVASGCPPRYSPSHTDLVRRVGPGRGGRHPRRLPRRRDGRPSSTPTTSSTASRSRPTSTAARRTSARSTTWGSPVPPAQTLATLIFDGVLERFPRPAHRRDRAGRHLGAVVAAPDGVRLRGLPPPRGAPAGAVAPAERLRAPPGPLHALPDRGRRLDRRARPAPIS